MTLKLNSQAVAGSILAPGHTAHNRGSSSSKNPMPAKEAERSPTPALRSFDFLHCAVQAFLDPCLPSRSRLLNGCDKVETAKSNGVNQNARAKSGRGIDPSAALVL